MAWVGESERIGAGEGVRGIGRLFRRARPPFHRNGLQREREGGYPPFAPPRRILVVKLFALGDMLNITPALRALRERYPEARIDVLATRGGAIGLQRSPFVDDVLIFDKSLFDSVGGSLSPRALLVGLRFAFDLRLRRYDTLVLLHHLVTGWGTIKYLALALWSGATTRVGLDNGRGWFLTHRVRDRGFGAIDERRYWLAVVAALDAHSDDDRPHFTVTAADRDAGARLLAAVPGSGPIVAIHPTNGSYAAGRQWPPERFAAVADRLVREWGARIVLVGTETAAIGRVAALMTTPPLDLAGRTDLPTLAGVLGHAALLIGNDSSVGHLAAALGVPVLALFGPSNDRAWAPWGTARVVLSPEGGQPPSLPDTRGIVVRSAVPQAPCLYSGFGPGNPDGCPHCGCLAQIDADRVAGLAGALLTRAGHRPRVPVPVA
jgi:ADP-heptose:LPS heptosyltransferase